MLQIFTEDSVILWFTENAKSNDNIVGSYLVNRCVICIDVYVYRSPKRISLHITPKISRFSFTCIIIKTTMVLEGYLKNYATWMFHKKPAPNPGTKGPSLETDRPQSVGSFYLVSIMPQILIKVSDNLKHPKNVKSISNTSVSHLVSCRVIPRPATMKMWENAVFWKIQALGNLKCNKSNNLESK